MSLKARIYCEMFIHFAAKPTGLVNDNMLVHVGLMHRWEILLMKTVSREIHFICKEKLMANKIIKNNEYVLMNQIKKGL